MNPSDYEFLSGFLMNSSGLALGPGKEYLLESRLVPLAQSLGLADFDGLVATLRRGGDKTLSQAVTEAMTTNETLFFRDKTPFEELKTILLPPLVEARKASRKLRIWCAASSTGQEPYSLAMLISEAFPFLLDWPVEIVATDISQVMLDRAGEAIYSQFEVQRGLPVQYLVKYFEQHPKGWRIKEKIRQRVSFQKLNLLENFSHLGRFDVLFCRNVLIYFDQATKRGILERMARMIPGDGYLILGAAETVLGITDAFARFRKCAAAVYTLPPRV
jgi:chemotaxis protein methyltransferase CheR